MLASHHNCRALVPDQRQLTDAQIKKLVGRGAVIGTALDDWMLYPGWVRGESRPELVKLEAMVDHIDRVCQLAGNARHAGIGTDLDGGFGKEQSPCDLDTIADLQRVPEMLKKLADREPAARETVPTRELRLEDAARPQTPGRVPKPPTQSLTPGRREAMPRSPIPDLPEDDGEPISWDERLGALGMTLAAATTCALVWIVAAWLRLF